MLLPLAKRPGDRCASDGLDPCTWLWRSQLPCSNAVKEPVRSTGPCRNLQEECKRYDARVEHQKCGMSPSERSQNSIERWAVEAQRAHRMAPRRVEARRRTRRVASRAAGLWPFVEWLRHLHQQLELPLSKQHLMHNKNRQKFKQQQTWQNEMLELRQLQRRNR